MTSKKYQYIFLIVQLAAISVFLGRAWQHIFWDVPYRSLLWDEELMSYILPWFSNTPYEDFITNVDNDDAIQHVVEGIGWFYLVCAVVAIFIKKIPRVFSYILWIGTASLVFLAFLYCKERFYQLGQFWEYILQFGSPIFLFVLWKKQYISEKLIFAMKVAIAITFIAHGLYALNFYPRPGNFIQMVIDILGVNESTAIIFLNVAGVLDFAIAIGIFLKGKIRDAALLYAIFWGLATSIARIWSHLYIDMLEDTLMVWVHEAVYRMPHFLIPLAVYYFYKKSDS